MRGLSRDSYTVATKYSRVDLWARPSVDRNEYVLDIEASVDLFYAEREQWPRDGRAAISPPRRSSWSR